MHIGVDRDSGLVHHVKTTSANEHDVTATSELMHGEEETLNGDSGYIGADKRPEAIRKNKQGKKIKYIINRKQSSINKLSKSGQYAAKKREHEKSSVSTYALRNRDEFISECIAESMTTKARPMSKQVANIITGDDSND